MAMTHEKADKIMSALQKKAKRAWEARDKFENALDKAKARKDWIEICEMSTMQASPDADAGDWMC